MTLASLERDHRRPPYAVSKTRAQEPAQERVSDAWPDFSTELSKDEIRVMVQKNSPARVLWQAIWAVVYSIGLVVGLMALLAAFGVR
jgi:hypothetical protein